MSRPPLPHADDVPLQQVGEYLRRLSHEVRNALNAIQLEASLLRQLVSDSEAVASVDRIRTQSIELTGLLKATTSRFRPPQVMKIQVAAGELLEFIRTEAHARPELRITWHGLRSPIELMADPVLVREIFRELFENAVRFPSSGGLTMTCRDAAKSISYELAEPKSETLEPQHWGGAFSSTTPGCAGLGLWWAHNVAGLLDADLTQCFDPERKMLVSTLTLPRE